MLRISELQELENALADKNSLKALELVNFGESFRTLAMDFEKEGNLSNSKIREIKSYCANFVARLIKELTERLPNCIHKLKNFAPNLVLAGRGRPAFNKLPFDLLCKY